MKPCGQNFTDSAQMTKHNTSKKVRAFPCGMAEPETIITMLMSVYWVGTPCGLAGEYQVKTVAVCSSKTSVPIYKSTWRYYTEDRHLQLSGQENHIFHPSSYFHFPKCNPNSKKQGSSVSAVPDYGLDGRGSIPDRGRGFFL
jgi:hypothetical protein